MVTSGYFNLEEFTTKVPCFLVLTNRHHAYWVTHVDLLCVSNAHVMLHSQLISIFCAIFQYFEKVILSGTNKCQTLLCSAFLACLTFVKCVPLHLVVSSYVGSAPNLTIVLICFQVSISVLSQPSCHIILLVLWEDVNPLLLVNPI